MLTIRRAKEIHHQDGGWLDARWHFSFDRYGDAEQTGVGALWVFNDDRIVAGADCPTHPHRDIESLTYVHSEMKGSGSEPRRFIQLWVPPSEPGLETSVQAHPSTSLWATGG